MSDIGSEDGEDQGPNLGTYEGERNDAGERHGQGEAVLPNGDSYKGQYANGKRNGYGVYKFKSGARYMGNYDDNQKSGEGTFYYPDGSKYEGQWVNDVHHGAGKYTYANGDTYEGNWENDLRNGLGTYTYNQTGVQYVGEWVNGRREGNGELLFKGYKFKGTFLTDQPHGAGKYMFDIGVQQLGDYVLEKPVKEGEEEEEEEEDIQKLNPRWQGGQITHA
ncbi:PREDICTED: radial spoke head 1 homolog isoform X2 [Amphimedon queenslandica]|uniref:Radial spoke head 1 homolog n=1 Tax=Amphimedon queenslandica TaxID=400682 RepID=A0A1X7UTC8_AMPQE|nr:PREDICTED: radial spoke head 1 homolog isoform X2 [Amphimedon queenslandica]|eukprot:XP_003386781.1 PREDICTED: radial spoke head 1 homolog isoform X2 [Amphimedon queenslandica]